MPGKIEFSIRAVLLLIFLLGILKVGLFLEKGWLRAVLRRTPTVKLL